MKEFHRGWTRDGERSGKGGVLLLVGGALSVHLVSSPGSGTDGKLGADVIMKRLLQSKSWINGGDEVK